MNYQNQQPSSSAPISQFGHHLLTSLRRASWVVIPALFLLALPSGANAATTYGGTEWLTFSDLKVASNGTEYTDVVGASPSWQARFTINASGVARVRNWEIYPSLGVGHAVGFNGVGNLDLSDYKAGKSYSFGQRPKNVDRTEGKNIPKSAVSSFAAAVCNQNLVNLMGQGQTRTQVLGQNRTVEAKVWPRLNFTPTVGDTLQELYPDQFIDIECEKSPFEPLPPGPGGITTDAEFTLDNAQLEISPSVYEGYCPKDLTLTMEVQGSSSGNFEARIESTDGWHSTKVVLGTNEFHRNTGLWGREFSEPLTFPLEHPTGGGGGGGVPAGPGSMTMNPGPGDRPTTGGIHGPGGLSTEDPGWNVHQASLRLVATANGKTVYSEWQQYRVTCEPRVVIPTGSDDYLPGTGGGGKPPKPGDEDKPDTDQPSNKPRPKPTKPTKLGKPTKVKAEKSSSAKGNQASSGKASGREATKPQPKPQSKPKPTPKPKPQSKPQPKPQPRPSTGGQELKGKPDLLVLEARSSRKRQGAIEFLVRNDGQANSGKSAARLSCGARLRSQSWDAPLPAIAAGGKQWIVSSPASSKNPGSAKKKSAAPAGATPCTIVLDPKNTVDETDERNNSHSCKDCQVGR